MGTGALHAQEKYSDKMARFGFIKVGVWVPEHRKKELTKLAEVMRKEHIHINQRDLPLR